MADMSRGKKGWLILAGVAVVCAAGVTVYWLTRPNADGPVRDHPPGFQDAARESGITFNMSFLPNEQGQTYKINLYDHGSGVAVGDYDGDGFDDIYFVNQLGPNALYRNKGDGTFVDVTKEAGVGLGDRICVSATWADYTNNGRQSLFVTSTRGGNVLFKNLGNGKFEDVTEAAGLTLIGHSQAGIFFDYDNDGFLDLLVINTAHWTAKNLDETRKYYPGPADLITLGGSAKETNVLYHNNKNGTFSKVTEKAGLAGLGWTADVAVFDYNDDGYLDVLLTNMFGRCQLYRNNGNGTFTDVTKETLGRTPWGGMGARAFDFNNDGKLDILIVDMHSDMWTPPGNDPRITELIEKSAKKKFPTFLGPMKQVDPGRFAELKQIGEDVLNIHSNEVVFGNTLFENRGGGKFAEVSDRAGMETLWPWGVATGDFDNDGFEDVFIPSGMGYPFVYWPNALMMNNGNGTFTDRALAEGIEPPREGLYQKETINGLKAARSSRCGATADFAGVGRLDIVTNNFNHGPYFFKNRFPQRNFLQLRLRGTKSNRDAIGALVKIYIGKEVMVRQAQAAGGYLSQSSKTLHFGLGARTAIDRLEIAWPSGRRQKIEKPEINRRLDIVEPS